MLPRSPGKFAGWFAALIWCSLTAVCAPRQRSNRLVLIPPAPVTTQVNLDVRGFAWNDSDAPATDTFRFYLDQATQEHLLHTATRAVPAHAAAGVQFRWPLAGRAGNHEIVLETQDGKQTHLTRQPLEVLSSTLRSTKRISGAWFEFYHWSEAEGSPWNSSIKRLTDGQWRELIRGMHRIGLNVVVVEELFRNIPNRYVDHHHQTLRTYAGQAMYPSRLYPARFPLAAADPLEDVLSEADALGMHVFVGLGNFAWFDFTPVSLAWHEAVADEVLSMYGRHPSFYGFYISAEIAGNLGQDDRHRRQLVDFFKGFQAHCRRVAPDKVIMLASNCHHVRDGAAYYPGLLSHLDILCPFGFARMPSDDWSGEQAMRFLQRQCDAAGCHLWMDLEAFVFGPGGALLPRPIEGIANDLKRFTGFETILCYAYTGLFNAPDQSAQPGGPATVRLYNAYRRYLKEGPPKPRTYPHDGVGSPYTLVHPPAKQYPGIPGGLTDGVVYPPDWSDFPWFGFLGDDLDITIDLGAEHTIRKITVGTMQATASGIYAPPRVEFQVSRDGIHYTLAGLRHSRLPRSEPGPRPELIALAPIREKARYVRVIAHNLGVLPPEHPHAGRPAWLFVDEVGVFYDKAR